MNSNSIKRNVLLLLLVIVLVIISLITYKSVYDNLIMERILIVINTIGVIVPFIILGIKIHKSKIFISENDLKVVDRFYKNIKGQNPILRIKNAYDIISDLLKFLIYFFEVSFILTITLSHFEKFIYFDITFNSYLLITIIIISCLSSIIKNRYYDVFHQQGINKILKLYDENFKIKLDSNLSNIKNMFKKSNYITKDHFKFEIVNSIKFNDTNNEDLLYKIKTSFDNFEGFFSHKHCDLDNHSFIIISNRNKKQKPLKRIILENDKDDFDTFFELYSNNENEAIKIIDDRICDFLLKLYYKYQCQFDLVINSNEVFIKTYFKDYIKSEEVNDKYEKYCLLSYYDSIRITEEIFNYFE